MNKDRPVFLALLLAFNIFVSRAQTGGDNTYEFLNLSSSALITSLGGINVSLEGTDPVLSFYNPALLNTGMNNSLSLNYVNYFAGINYGNASYGFDHEKYGMFSAGITYLNYGKFNLADPSGIISGTFSAAEYALSIIWSYEIDSLFRIGINVKPVISHLERYTSIGMAFDLGGYYKSRNGYFTAGLVIRNTGFQLTSYTGSRENLPFEIISGVSYRLEHAPFRFSATIRHMEKYDLIYQYTETDETGPAFYEGVGAVTENLMRHMVFSTEFLPSENFYLSAGFNYQRRKEMMLDYRASSVGFSMGAGIKLSSFDLSLSRSRYHLAGSVTNISLLLKPTAFRRRN